jgi:hypothetical protein
MDVSASLAEFWLDIAQTMEQDSSGRSWQDEPVQSGEMVEDPICLFGQFVSVVSSDVKNIRPRSEVS